MSDNQQKQEFLTSTIPISSEEYVIVAAPELLAEYNIKPAERVTLASLHRLPFIAMADNLMFSDITYSFCLQAGFTPWLVLETNDFATKLHMSALGTAAAFIPEICIADFKALRDDFCFLYLSDINTRRTIRLGRKRSSETSPLAQTFWDFACNYYSRSAIP